MAFDYLLKSTPNCFIVLSTGNYRNKRIHASGRLAKGQIRDLHVFIGEFDLTSNELEIWYDGEDAFSIKLESPAGYMSSWISLGNQGKMKEHGSIVGRIYNRERDPYNLEQSYQLLPLSKCHARIYGPYTFGRITFRMGSTMPGWKETTAQDVSQNL